MAWISDSLSVIANEWGLILRILAVFSVGGILTFGLLRLGLQDSLGTTEAFLLAMAGWPLWWVMSASLAFLIARRLEVGPGSAVFLLSVVGLLLVAGWKKIPAPLGKPAWILLALALTFLLSLFTRLAYLTDLWVPSYFDSALHFGISQHLLTHFGQWPWETSPPLVKGYYHIGFHLLTAISVFLTETNPAQAILILGQFILAVMPFPLFLVTKRETGSTLAAFLALVLAGWGWNMPAHALNWGKYPALAGLLALQFTLALVYTASRATLTRRDTLHLLALFLAGTTFSALMHTRSLLVILIFVISYYGALSWEALPNRFRGLSLALLLAGLGGLTIYLESRVALKLVFDPYLRAGWWMTLLMAALSPFAFWRFGRLAMTCLLALFLLLAGLLVPVPGNTFQTVLDRPFVQMMLFLPLALLAGLGLAGLGFVESFPRWLTALATAAVFSAVFVHIGRNYTFLPSPCCILFQHDDAIAFDWMDKSLPEDAQILIAGNTLNVFDTERAAELRGSDGGIWMTPLIGRRTFLSHIGADFSRAETFSNLCQRGITHIYVGGTQEHFDLAGIRSRPEWYAWQFALPEAHLFRLVNCP